MGSLVRIVGIRRIVGSRQAFEGKGSDMLAGAARLVRNGGNDSSGQDLNLFSPRFWLAFLIIGSLFWASIFLRALADTQPGASSAGNWVVAMLLIFLVLFLTARPISQRLGWYPHVYFAFQVGFVLIFFLSRRFPEIDYIAALLIPLSAHVFLLVSGPSRFRWIAVFIFAVVIGLIASQGWPEGLPFALLYAASYVFVSSYAVLMEQAERARAQSRELLRDLQLAYDQLQAYAAQAEEMAVMAERTRLARDLHDAVSQNLFGLTLAAETASRAQQLGRDDVMTTQLGEIKAAARQALGELRLLVYELRPEHLDEHGLVGSIQARLDTVESRAGLATTMSVTGDGRLPIPVEVELDRIAQETLNNVIKHARARNVEVYLALHPPGAIMSIVDDGIGIDAPAGGSGLGLRGMAERAERIGGTLTVTSEPGQGTRIVVEVRP